MAEDAAQFTFESKEWTKAIRKIESKWKDIETRKTFAGIISATVFQDIMDHFDQERGPDGSWQAWSKSYAEHMKKIGRSNNKLLQFNGKLRQSFTPDKWRGTAAGIVFYNRAKTKSGFPYAKAHDEGGTVKGKPPKRSFMWLSKQAMNDIVDRTLKWLSE